MATFTDCADNLTCATLSGSNGIGVALAVGSPNKIVVSASNVPNSALANSSININGTTIALGASGSITVGGGTVTSVSAGTNLSASGTSTDPVLNLTGNITSGLTSITGLTNISSNTVTGTNISATDINTTTLTGSVSGTSAQFTNLTASHISSSTLTGSISGASGQFIALTGSNIYSNTVTGSVSGTSGQFGSATINTLNSTKIIATTVSGAFSGSGALIDDITASHIYHFQEDVRSQFTEGNGISILLGQISVTNVPNSSLANTGSTIGSTAVVLGTTVPNLTGLTNFSSTNITGTTGISSSLGTFTTLTASNGKVLTTLSASQITASFISGTQITGAFSGSGALLNNLTGSSVNFPNFASDVRKQISGTGVINYNNSTGIISYTGGGGTVTSVTAGANISGSGTSTAPTINLTSSITGGLTNISGTTTITSVSGNFINLTGSNISGTNNLIVGGNIGVGTTSPTNNIHIRSTGSSVLFLESDVLNTNPPEANAKILMSQDGGISTANFLMTSASDGQNDLIIGVNSTTSPSMHFALSSSGTAYLTSSAAAKLSILYNGNVGIGTTTPVTKLEVTGTGVLFTDTANTSIFTNASYWQQQIHREANLLTLTANGRNAGHLVLTAPEYLNTDPVGYTASAALYMGVYSATGNPGYSWLQSATTSSTPVAKTLYLNPAGGAVNIGSTLTTLGELYVGTNTYTNNGTLTTRDININSGYGIIFNSTNAGGSPSPTISSNTLNDYEYGIWTPILYNATTAQNIDLAGATYAKYTKIGNKVFLLVDIIIFSAGNFSAMANGSLRINNLPYSWDGSLRGRASCFYYTPVAASLTSAPFGMVEGNYVVLYQHASLGIANLAKVDLTNLSRLMFEISYTTT